MARQIFYSFHYDNDVFRVQMIRNIGALEENKPVSVNEWETVKKAGDAAIEKWIDDTMKYRSCVVVLIGSDTSNRKWVKYEIQKAWRDGKGLLGIYVHNLNCPRNGTCYQGTNPFSQFRFKDANGNVKQIPCKNPSSINTYGEIKDNLEKWVNEAIANRS
jgi:hypothetical protein